MEGSWVCGVCPCSDHRAYVSLTPIAKSRILLSLDLRRKGHSAPVPPPWKPPLWGPWHGQSFFQRLFLVLQIWAWRFTDRAVFSSHLQLWAFVFPTRGGLHSHPHLSAQPHWGLITKKKLWHQMSAQLVCLHQGILTGSAGLGLFLLLFYNLRKTPTFSFRKVGVHLRMSLWDLDEKLHGCN